MRIIAGDNRGLTLASVGKGDPGAQLRPTSDRVRESLFNVLRSHGVPDSDTRVLDLFAGTGALGLEALSRGAAQATFVDDGRVALGLIRDNIAKTRRADQATVIARSALLLPQATTPCDLIFLDPPYGRALGQKALEAAQLGGWIAPGAMIVWEESAAQPVPAGFTLVDQRRYGDTWITLLEAAQ